MTVDWPKTLRPRSRKADNIHGQKTVVISRQTNRWPFGENTGLFGGSLMWIVEALAAAPANSHLYFQSFNDAYELSTGVRTTRSWTNGGTVAVPRWTDDMIDFLLEQRTAFSPNAERLELHPKLALSAVPLDKGLTLSARIVRSAVILNGAPL